MIRNSIVVFLSMEGCLSNIGFTFWPSFEVKEDAGMLEKKERNRDGIGFCVIHPNFEVITGRSFSVIIPNFDEDITLPQSCHTTLGSRDS